ncbi:DUF7257 domain-containing protein [Mycolicibacterium sphagni]|uniref:DUF7257 domain-containing protein n=1 Tax=Mycolicibacterium sphagni TaxID=1786 RepID=A0A255DXF0_9MYCO|nr:hypothetical protein [Mycolicibacterium sphagni]OYN80413.1 hypothetical protein CG716_09790 [Mycolicibacterium sphagni]
MTQPDGLLPHSAFNYGSLAALAAKSEAEWRADLEASVKMPFDKFFEGLFAGLSHDLQGGIEFSRAVLTEIARRIVALPGTIYTSVEAALTDLANFLGLKWVGIDSAQSAADYANEQLLGLLVTDVTGGVSLNSPFDGPAATNLGGSFTQVYSGPGGGTWGVDGFSSTKWNRSGGQYRRCIARHNTPLATSTQRIRLVISTLPWTASAGGAPVNYACGRVNAACDSYVYARYNNNGALRLGCVSAGTDTEFNTVSFNPALGNTIDLYLGTDNSDRQFLVRRNGVDVMPPYTDTAGISAMGPSNLFVGLGAMATDRNVFTEQSIPGGIGAWGAIDRQATTY